MCHRPRPHLRSAPPAPSDTTSTAPAHTPGACPPDNPWLSAPGRTATNGRSHAEGTPGPRASAPASVLSAHLESTSPAGRAGTASTEAVTHAGNLRGRRPATGRYCHTPHGRAPSQPPSPATGTPTSPTVAVGPGLATQPRTARSLECPQDTSGVVTRHRRRRDRPVPTCAPGTPRPRTAPGATVPRPPGPSPRGTRRRRPISIANRPRPSTYQRCSGILPGSDRGPGPPPPAVRIRRNVRQSMTPPVWRTG